ncbi:MAG: tetratricopeptide repeat protein [Acidobacteriaceae bacterium]|nr:tetratricopeptide repeat protein [Acidobacteriaceae bacterium]MBV9764333.1 tetratricopeptide repeat protein [Acidobacteriaceae bacterium]
MMRVSRWIVFLLVLGGCLSGQERRSRIDVHKYTIDAEINPRTQSIVATTRINFTALETANDAVFELNNALSVTKAVDSRGQTLQTSRNAQDFTFKVSFPGGIQKNQPYDISVTYDGKLTGNEDSPVSGIKFAALHPDYGYLLYPARWFPVSGYTVNRFAADLHITTPGEYRVIASGDLKTDRAGNGGTIFSYHYDKTSFPGSIAIEKADPVRVSSQGIATQVFFRDHEAANAQAYGDEVGKILTFLTSQYGLAPQANLALIETESGAVNGYSAPGIVFLAPESISNHVNTRVLANQLSRQWWGVLVSPANRNHLWLLNGPARFSELLYLEHTAGPGAAENDLKATYVEALTVKDPPVLQAARLDDYSPEYWALTAAKGAAILNMLRNVVGDANFEKGMQAFLDKYSWQSATSEDFRKIMEQVSDQDLRYFFIQWLESSGSPEFKLEYTVLRTQQGFRVVGKINQDLDTFRMPVDLRIETEGNPEDKKIEVTGTSSEFSVDTFGKPRKLILDPNHVLLRLDPSIQIAVAIKRGEEYFGINDYQNALKEYQKALEVNRNSSLAHYRIGELFFQQHNFQSAANEFRAAINGDLDPKWTEVWSHVNLGKIFDVTGQRDRAVNEYKQAIRTHDNTGGAQEEAARYSTKPYEQKNSET